MVVVIKIKFFAFIDVMNFLNMVVGTSKDEQVKSGAEENEVIDWRWWKNVYTGEYT